MEIWLGPRPPRLAQRAGIKCITLTFAIGWTAYRPGSRVGCMVTPRAFSLFMALLSLPFGAVAASAGSPEAAWKKQDASGTEHFILLHEEESGWVAESFAREPGMLQDREWRQPFPKREQALVFLKSRLRGFSQGVSELAEPEGARKSATELKNSGNHIDKAPGLWKATETWSWAWEEKYAQWVIDTVDSHFFVQHQIETDCADVAFALKWIFARINGLPMGNQLAGSSDLFTQESMKSSWASLPTDSDWTKDKRFLKALDYLLVNTYTQSLLKDSYPIRIAPDTLIPGVHHLNLAPGHHHTRFLRKIDIDHGAPLVLVASDAPRIIRELNEGGFWDFDQPKDGEGGLLRIRWLVKKGAGWRLAAPADMPDYSKEEFDPKFLGTHSDFATAVLEHFAPNVDFAKRVGEGVDYVKFQLQTRKQIVEDGYAVCQKESCAEGTVAYENWSTPARDARIEETFSQIEGIVNNMGWQYPGIFQLWQTALQEKVLTLDGATFHTLEELREIWRNTKYSFDPRKPISVRWGM